MRELRDTYDTQNLPYGVFVTTCDLGYGIQNINLPNGDGLVAVVTGTLREARFTFGKDLVRRGLTHISVDGAETHILTSSSLCLWKIAGRAFATVVSEAMVDELSPGWRAPRCARIQVPSS